jgi:hypothetical protein
VTSGGRIISSLATLHRAQTAEPRPALHPRRPTEQHGDRIGEEEGHEQIDEGDEAEGEGEAPHVSDGHDVEHDRGEQGDEVRREDRATRRDPADFGRRSHGLPVAQGVPDALKVDDERVGCETDGHDRARNAGKCQGESNCLAKRDEAEIGEPAGQHEAGHGDDAHHAVVHEQEHDDEDEADRAGDETGPELITADGRGHTRDFDDLEVDRQRAVAQNVREVLRLLSGEVALDLSLAADDRLVEPRGRDDHAVQHDREGVAGCGAARGAVRQRVELLGRLRESAGTVTVKGEADDPSAHALLGKLRDGVGDIRALDEGGLQGILRRAIGITRAQPQLGVVRASTRLIDRVKAVQSGDLSLELRGVVSSLDDLGARRRVVARRGRGHRGVIQGLGGGAGDGPDRTEVQQGGATDELDQSLLADIGYGHDDRGAVT